ncbi:MULTISPECIES: hypothetical protein [unclassified Nocardioides]|uniref:hypothetical protein n=1 Tax=unclassified Nocardioides TaxID=2615069 RepID=UPI0009F012AC|nr:MULTISPECIES: hypothetical protein [unclassified Nocardioides]GAW50621.1 hypothetical protein PD653B2_2957 [Nocardioides sp. PD653-B2]GAW55520.1 hypothetical protein PD653_2945 [Nocardioides sp. PD653]
MAREITEVQTTGTVSSAAPLEVVVDGATVACPAATLNGQAYTVGQRVTVTVRNPLLPLVQGVES